MGIPVEDLGHNSRLVGIHPGLVQPGMVVAARKVEVVRRVAQVAERHRVGAGRTDPVEVARHTVGAGRTVLVVVALEAGRTDPVEGHRNHLEVVGAVRSQNPGAGNHPE